LAVALLLAAALLAGLAWLWRQEAQFPGSHPLADLNRLHLTVTGLGQCLALDRYLWTPTPAQAVERWYQRRGWQPIAPLWPGWRLGALSAGRFIHLEPAGGQATRIFQRQAVCVQT
jgi:hypothetical protein